MKKMYFFIIALFVVFVATGCGKDNTKVLTCTGVSLGNNMNAGSEVVYTFENDKLTKAKVEVKFQDITVDNLASLWESYKIQFTEQNPPVEELGFVRTVKSDDKNYTFSVIMEIDFEKITKDVMEKYEIEDYSAKTYDQLKEEATIDGTLTCK